MNLWQYFCLIVVVIVIGMAMASYMYQSYINECPECVAERFLAKPVEEVPIQIIEADDPYDDDDDW